jgi:hypothetical protein
MLVETGVLTDAGRFPFSPIYSPAKKAITRNNILKSIHLRWEQHAGFGILEEIEEFFEMSCGIIFNFIN